MDEELSQPDSVFLLNQNGRRRLDTAIGGDDDRLSELPNEILFVILSLLPVRRAASTTVLSSRWLDLWKQIPDLRFNLESDRISQLPDRIISDILSFLPLKQAVATSVLSSRWLDSWKHTHNLLFRLDTFGDLMEDACKYVDIMNSILQSHKARSLKLLRISLLLDKSAQREVAKWLEFVFLRQVERFELSLFCFEGEDKVVLKELLRELNTLYGDPRTLIFFQSLKSLHLAFLEVSGEDIELFLRNCPLLEGLSISSANLTSDIEVCSPSLKRLEISKCSGGKSVEVTAPNLTFIRFIKGAGKLLLENVPSLVEAVFDISTSEFIKHHFASEASRHISQLQCLIIRLPCPKMFLTNEAFPQMPNLKKLVIYCFKMYNHSLLPVTRLIWASPHLEEFTLEFCGTFEAPAVYMGEMTNVAGRSPHQHLKVFRLFHYEWFMREHVVELTTYVANNCVALRRIDMLHVPDDLRDLLQSQVPNHVQLSFQVTHELAIYNLLR